MDAYLKRFEGFAESAEWDRSCWAINLSALLQGTALDVYSRLSSSEALDYGILLKRFHFTEEVLGLSSGKVLLKRANQLLNL